jgi:hypothetical protein
VIIYNCRNPTWKNVRMKFTLSKWGLESPLGLLETFKVWLHGSKHLTLGCSLYHWKAIKV